MSSRRHIYVKRSSPVWGDPGVRVLQDDPQSIDHQGLKYENNTHFDKSYMHTKYFIVSNYNPCNLWFLYPCLIIVSLLKASLKPDQINSV